MPVSWRVFTKQEGSHAYENCNVAPKLQTLVYPLHTSRHDLIDAWPLFQKILATEWHHYVLLVRPRFLGGLDYHLPLSIVWQDFEVSCSGQDLYLTRDGAKILFVNII